MKFREKQKGQEERKGRGGKKSTGPTTPLVWNFQTLFLVNSISRLFHIRIDYIKAAHCRFLFQSEIDRQAVHKFLENIIEIVFI